jgi:DNA-binding IclR family transcriptional regulator
MAGKSGNERSSSRGAVHGVIRRAAVIIRILSGADRDGMSAAEVARQSHLPLQTGHRLLKELEREGFAVQEPASRLWTLGPEFVVLGDIAQRQVDWVSRVRSVLAEITRESEETTIFTVRSGAYATILELEESPQPLRLIEHKGLRLPLTVGASRRVILAALSAEERVHVLDQLRSDGVGFDQREVERDCLRIAGQGYAVSVGSVTPHTVGVAVPVLLGRVPVGSLTAAGPDSRMAEKDAERYSELLRRRLPEAVQLWNALRRSMTGSSFDGDASGEATR